MINFFKGLPGKIRMKAKDQKEKEEARELEETREDGLETFSFFSDQTNQTRKRKNLVIQAFSPLVSFPRGERRFD